MSPAPATRPARVGDTESLPWRGPGPGRPELAIPPRPMPLFKRGSLRKSWRYVGYFGDDVMLCLARVSVGPLTQSFFSLWDRVRDESLEHTRMWPGRPEVMFDGPYAELRSERVRASLLLGDGGGEPIEVVCPSGRAWTWTRKRAGFPISGVIEADGRTWELDGLGVDDQSAGYHARHTKWNWSTGVGLTDGDLPVAWNLVVGINGPPESSERTVWVDGEPVEVGPVVFHDLDRITFEDGSELEFEFGGKAERFREDDFGLVKTSYLHRFGTFSGSLAGTELRQGRGVMEDCSAVW